jgi:hypothetical protein
VVQWKEKSLSLKGSILFLESPSLGRPEFNSFFYINFGGQIRSSEAAMGGGGARSAPFGVEEPRKTGARSARACTRGQNPLVLK